MTKKDIKIKIYTSDDVESGGDKARAAAKLGDLLKQSGMEDSEAGRGAAHELKHALKKKTRGRFGYEVDPKTKRITGAFYEHENAGLTDEDLLDILTAPGKDMSEDDKMQAAEIRKRKAKKKNWLLHLLGF